MPSYERLDYGSPDGSQWGTVTTDSLGMYGATPVQQYTLVGVASTYSISHSTSGSSTWGFSTSTMASSLIFQVSTLTAALRAIGLVL